MKHLVLAACIGAMTLTAGAALAQEPAKKPAATKKAPAKKSAKKATPVAEVPATPNGEKWQCELGHAIYISGDMRRDEVIVVNWEAKEYRLPRQATVTGADRYFDARSGLDLVVIPSKAMLFNKNLGQRLADECQNADMQAGGAAPTVAGALRAPVATPLLAAPAAAPAPAPQPEAQAQPATLQAAPKP
ncbi:hypothetical protein [Cupriavidus plantarum]|uniref:Uncharacterized protein n=1 Tax=Cupriavidus plantarum TaxID=942865 RepID=A0A316EVL2_9BURK|nr:hypothetical protein [Cupriavidus plantarum]NYH99492.1 hypothetical protein [Cupriavidus plantarum]PWK36704.1 hypothetical protein C7419_101565 [Cupriavidus plantarum]REF02560.1 hypothetical protein C7418_1376 [Cupriavidus plantarum]RLK44589.1 hypothetical protein C7417_0573 [Cupriavidus plantarum]CAG2143868.1 hypothetical protein LMG26296_03505 [Cupriavidus plantarum]